MNDLRWERALAAARDDRPAPLDVSARVAASVAALPTPVPEAPLRRWLRRLDVEPSLAAAAGLSLAAAAAALVVATPWMTWLLDPLVLWSAR